jgi:Ca2+-binding RTX toxin-like protein
VARSVRISILAVAVTLAAFLSPTAASAAGSVSIIAGGTVSQDFNTLAPTGSDTVMPIGWEFVESGTNANTTYTADDGSLSAGNTYSYGPSGNVDRALGALQSGALVPLIGVGLSNGGPVRITQVDVTYGGEQWRLGTDVSRVDRLDAEYSTNASSLTTGTWTAVDGLDFTAPVTTGGPIKIDGNGVGRTIVAGSISGLNLATGQAVWIRWVDLNATGADDGLAVDDFSATAVGPACTITGTSGDDNLKGTAGPDVICAGDGKDAVIGLGGADVLYGEGGNDFMAGGTGNDALDGGGGIDTATFGDSGVTGPVSADLAAGSASNTVLGQDTLLKVAGVATIENLTGGPGNDVLTGDGVRNVLVGEGGNDQIAAGNGDDLVRGVGGDDTLDGGAGDDRVQPGLGNDTLTFGTGLNTLDYSDLGGTGAGQTIDSTTVSSTGFAGTDDIQTGAGVPFINVFGSARDDTIVLLGPVASLVIGAGGDDQIQVNEGDELDTVYGGLGSDTCLVDPTEPEDCELP